jgi:hypothetical protein
MTQLRLSDQERQFWDLVELTEGCWIWHGLVNRYGYGTQWWNGRRLSAHRLAYTLAVGPIPEGLTLDHVKARGCTSLLCVKAIPDWFGPAHLEPVTMRENVLRGESPAAIGARKTHCPKGHPYDEANTYRYRGKRSCRACNRAAVAALRVRKLARP